MDVDELTKAKAEPAPTLRIAESEPLITDEAFSSAYGETIDRAIDIGTWHAGEDMADLYSRLDQVIGEAVHEEDATARRVRDVIFPRLAQRPGAPPGAGVYQAQMPQLERVHRGLLFNGGVEGCDGTSLAHETLPISITQIGICLVSYAGNQGSWIHHLYRRDFQLRGGDPVEEALTALDRRMTREAAEARDQRDKLSDLARRGIMTYAERAVLLERSSALWRMGHGNPVPYELLSGTGHMRLVEQGLKVLRSLLLDHRRVVFVPSEPNERLLLTIGNALRPLEFAIVDTLETRLRQIVEVSRYKSYLKIAQQFVKDVGPEIVVGVFRATDIAPPHVFYAVREHACEAALIAMADSVLQYHRGFPMLIDLADTVCRSVFGSDSFNSAVQTGYAESGAPTRYLLERQTRR